MWILLPSPMIMKHQFQYAKQLEHGIVLDIISQHQSHVKLLSLQQM